MSPIAPLNSPAYVATQYRDATHLNARIRLHQRFSTNPQGWMRWFFEQLHFPPQGRVLELGCGPGNLWLENADRLPTELAMLLSDQSPGMVAQARQALAAQAGRLQFQVIDAQALPFPAQHFDVVLACHMLYHVPNRAQAVAEIRRVLKPGGRLYAATVGEQHLREMQQLVTDFDPRLAQWRVMTAETFTLENGAAQLAPHFAEVTRLRYPDALVVTEVEPLRDYMLSGRLTLADDQIPQLTTFLQHALRASGGQLHITKDTGFFEAR